MLYFTRWKALAIILTALVVCLCAVPNFFPEARVKTWPVWAQRHIVLGLDLQGGSSLLLEVDSNYVKKEKLEQIRDDTRRVLREAKIQYTGLITRNDVVEVRITKDTDVQTALSKLRELSQPLGGLLGSSGQRSLEVADGGGGLIRLTVPPAAITDRIRQSVEQSIQIVEKRVNELGTVEPSIQRQGDDRILVQVPGLQDPTQLKNMLGKTAKMSFQLVDEQADPTASVAPIGDEILPVLDDKNKNAPPRKVAVQRRVMVAGDRLTDASQGFDQQTGQPIVNFRFDSVGARQFGDVTKEHVGHRFAIVLDKQVISDPNINSVILGGSGYIIGSFTAQSANEMAILLRAGALPAPLKPLEERSVGAELGADSIKAGRYSALAGLAMVALFMILRYGLFGVFADIALTLNIVLLLAVLTAFGATLTLPGIAGIVLTMGMAVDANVLIYERIREEQRNGRTMLAAIDTGFRRAMATIIDANMTHLIASLILFQLGTGPIKGFAVTLGVGIITSFFTAVMVTRLIVITWLNVARPRKLTI